jgi:3-deoxy-D-manno-octulosonic acid kinase
VIDPTPISGTGALLLADTRHEPILRDWIGRHGSLIRAAESAPGALHLAGRGRVAAVLEPDSEGSDRWVVRHYHRGGAVASALGDRYLQVGTPRPFQELRLLVAARARGVPAPEPVGAAVYPAGPFYRGDLVTRWVPDSADLATILFDPVGARPVAERVAAMHAAGRLIRLLHERGVEHRDLNLKNILLAEHVPGPGSAQGGTPVALILDLDRARLHDGAVSHRSKQAMIERFWRSARKWERRTGSGLGHDVGSAFDAGYSVTP